MEIPNPEQIDTTKHFYDAFGNCETEISARWIVRLCQKRNIGWEPFTYNDIDGFYRSKGFYGFTFNNLITGRYIEEKNGLYHITLDFVVRCYKSSPKEKEIN
ncbi:hypothetical protein A2V49_01535 [candidate division WWE3 bacterium RBG_19FT_COMBO_34_6]|uniref:Uncharacterized protein n=1 Tax=candidate division WWE3 bacterium RBG_19FT_COMBO_34_6 TaxID=1802612 RepID=A0A1F4UM34_UNCKA|nr:MAG: hypothetical protein A2V49_01535 [candidate division WWE3 bacterium RBG_19FT_COMBO_34_6]